MNPQSIKTLILSALAAIGSVISNQLGGWDAAMQVLMAMMAIDYVTGVMVAAFWKRSNKTENGALDSRAGFKGLVKKIAILALVWISVMLDKALGTDYIRTAVIIFFIGNEGLSLLENIGLMGVPYPEFLRKMLEVLKKEGDQAEKEKRC